MQPQGEDISNDNLYIGTCLQSFIILIEIVLFSYAGIKKRRNADIPSASEQSHNLLFVFDQIP